jgi:hypothetical protein
MKVAVAGLGWSGNQIICCLGKYPRFEAIVGSSRNDGAVELL